MYNVSTSTETQITSDEADQQNPDIYGDRIVWQDSRNGGGGDFWDPSGNWDIYMYDISTSTETRITTNASRQINPAIYGDRIVWQDDRNGNQDIYMYDISTSTETQITHNVSDQIYPNIYEDRIVWIEEWTIYMYDLSTSKETRVTPYFWGLGEENLGDLNHAPFIYGDRIVCATETITGNYIIKMYDLSTSAERMIGEGDANSNNPAIYGDIIVWEDGRNNGPGDGNRDIYMYDLSTSTETQITTNLSRQADPAIYGDRIVWTDERNTVTYDDMSDIYMYDLSNSEEIRITTAEEEQLAQGTETRITTNDSGQEDPAIYGDRIVWTDWRNDNGSYTNSDIYMYDLLTSTETQITTNGSNQMWPAIYGNRIVWTDERNGNEDIYMYDLSTSTETQITSNESNQYGSAIYEDRIVWLDKRNSGSVPDDGFGGFDVYMYNLSTKKETRITKSTIPINPDMGSSVNIYDNKIVCYMGPSGISVYDLSTRQENVISDLQLYNLAFSGNRIVGTNDWEGREGVVYMYDLSTAMKTKITAKGSAYGGPDISGNLIVWPDLRNSGHPSGLDLYMYDLSTSTESRITTSKSVAWSVPSIYGDRIVWEDNRNGSDIYMFTLASAEVPEPPVADFSANITSGYAPLSVLFTDLFENATEWNWDFGDGATSIEHNPVHTYSAAGNYTVNLTVSNSNGTDSKLATITVLAKPSNADAAPFAYITNDGDNTVSVIDTATNTVTATVNVGSGPVGVAVTPDGTKVYVANGGSNNVSVIDTVTNTVTATVNVGSIPRGVATSPDGTKVYVANYGGNTVSVINTATSTITATVTVGNHPFGVAVTGTKAFVTNDIDKTVSVIDTATDTVTATVNLVNQYPGGVAASPDGTKVYVTSGGTDNVSVIDTATNTVTATVPVGDKPTGVTVAGTKVYVANFGSNTVSVIDTATNTVTATVDVGNSPYGVAVTPDGTEVYVANDHENTVYVIDTATNTVTATVSVGSLPKALGQFIGPLPTPELIDPSDINITRITTSGSASDPRIYGDRIVWADWRNGNYDIYMYDLSSSTETQITTNMSNQSMPVIYGDKIVWMDDRNDNGDWWSNFDIYMYDLSTSTETQVTTNESNQMGPAIYGNRIVWEDYRNEDSDLYIHGNSDVYMYDLSTHKETQITTNEGNQWDPAIYGDRIVWTDSRYGQTEGQSNIFMYDLSTSKETQITANGSDHVGPVIYGDRIAYANFEFNEIFMYDIFTHKETQITDNGGGLAGPPAFYGDRIVWHEWRNENMEIYMYNISASTGTQITGENSWQLWPDIYGDRIVWQGERNGNLDIYMFTLASAEVPEPPVADFSANITSGYAPLSVLFTDLFENATEWNWDFGDGDTSTEQNPVHTYSVAGNYTVSLTVSNSNGKDSKIATITILAQPVLLPVFPGYTNPATDLDQDGIYEDINGNGILDFDDVVAYYDNMEWIDENVPLEFFDYNKNGLIDFDDVVKLYDML